jgi:hypothetical protein
MKFRRFLLERGEMIADRRGETYSCQLSAVVNLIFYSFTKFVFQD